MNFKETLNNMINKLNCSYFELAKASGLSKSTISRYINGSRIPTNPSIQLDKLINGLAIIAQEKSIEKINKNTITETFNNIIKTYNTEKIINNFNLLISSLKINISEFSKTFGYDASHLSRIRSKERKPSDPSILFDAIISFIISKYSDENNKKTIAHILNCPLEKIKNSQNYKQELEFWLYNNSEEIENNDINNFLSKLNEFDLNEYIRVINFNELKIPSVPFEIRKSKVYYGIKEMKQGELDFLKSTVLSKSKKSVFMCSDMQMDDMAKDLEFGKKWMFGIAMMLKKGLHLDVIHNIDRPFDEMMIGLESWIPIYMTGQVSPYYLNNNQDNIYSHLNYLSGSVALNGECIKGFHSKGKYYLTNKKKELEYYNQKAKLILKKAKPLMNIYCEEKNEELNDFLNKNVELKGNINRISASLPIYTISKKTLLKILTRNNISKENQNIILNYVINEKERIQKILKENQVQEIINNTNKNEFNKFPICLDLSLIIYTNKIIYNYNEYLEHLKETNEYEKSNQNYTLILNDKNAFRNIQITIHKNKWVMISKINNPITHFVIKQPKLCKAIENFIVPIIEKK